MDFEDAKENIQPLAAGRNASILQAALHTESQEELQQQRRIYEDAIENYAGDDPLEPWFQYVYWIEQSYPSGGKESGLDEVLIKCLTKFEKDQRYHQDRRMIKLYIKYIDNHEKPQECYQKLYHEGIGTMVADLYICWAYYYDLLGDFRSADEIFRKGLDCHAQPIQELKEAHQHFGFTMSQRILYNDDLSKEKYQSSLQEKRSALISLKSHKKQVGSIRTGAAVKRFAPGTVQVKSTTHSQHQKSIKVFNDSENLPCTIPTAEIAAGSSVVKTILDNTRNQENMKEAGPWSKAVAKKKMLFNSEPRSELGFEILEDQEDDPLIKNQPSDLKPFIYLDGFKSSNKPQENWIVPVTTENQSTKCSYVSYDKCLTYPKPNMEFSLEELGCYLWCKKKNIENKFTQKYDMVWKNNVQSGLRMYPNFAKTNDPMKDDEKSKETDFDPFESLTSEKSKLVIDVKLYYHPKSGEECQFEEIMYQQWKNGKRKFKYDCNETIARTEEMEETMCVPQDGVRRKSFFPTRLSIMPLHHTNVEPPIPLALQTVNENEEELPAPSSHQHKGILKKLTDCREPTKIISFNTEQFAFKAPATPPSIAPEPHKTNFQIFENEEDNNYEANESCSTQVFNCFIKPNWISTPNAPSKVAKVTNASDRQPTSLNFSEVENAAPSVSSINQNQNCPAILALSPDYNDAGLTLRDKQLSTIMETSEHATGSTGSTKSSINPPDFDFEVHQSRLPLMGNICNLETVDENKSIAEKDCSEKLMISIRQNKENILGPMVENNPNEISRLEQPEDTVPTMPAVRIFEDKTETVPKILITKMKHFPDVVEEKESAVKYGLGGEKKANCSKNQILACDGGENMSFFDKQPNFEFSKKDIPSSPTPTALHNSIFTSSAFMKFQDSPKPMLKLNESQERVVKRVSEVKKPSESSFFSTKIDGKDGKNKTFDSMFLPNISTAKQSKPDSKKAMDNSFLPGFANDTSLNLSLEKYKQSTKDPFLSGFPSVAIGEHKPPEDSFVAYLAKNRQQNENKPKETSKLNIPNDSLLASFGAVDSQFKTKDFPITDNKENIEQSFMLSLSPDLYKKSLFKIPTVSEDQPIAQKNISFLPNLSTTEAITKFQIHEDTDNSGLSNKISLLGVDEPQSKFGHNTNLQPNLKANYSSPQLKSLSAIEKENLNTTNSEVDFPMVKSNQSSRQSQSQFKTDCFFEDNIRTEAFAVNLSMIKNSTLLPNYDVHQSQIKRESINIVDSASSMPSTTPSSSATVVPPEDFVHRSIATKTNTSLVESFGRSNKQTTKVPRSTAEEFIEITESDDEDCFGKSIYYTKTPKTPQTARHAWTPEQSALGHYETPNFHHQEIDMDHTQQIIDDICVARDVNPFNKELIDAFLNQVEIISFVKTLPTCQLVRKIAPLKKDTIVQFSGKVFNVLKLIGEGTFGSVYSAKESHSGKLFALKQERPANLWEYYICLELQSRLHSTDMMSGFMKIEYALIGNNASILISNFTRHGSLIAVCNKIKKETLKNVDEYVVMHMASQLLLIMDHLHASNIIHADVKPDNFVLMEKTITSICFVCNLPILSYQVGLVWQGGNGWDDFVREQLEESTIRQRLGGRRDSAAQINTPPSTSPPPGLQRRRRSSLAQLTDILREWSGGGSKTNKKAPLNRRETLADLARSLPWRTSTTDVGTGMSSSHNPPLKKRRESSADSGARSMRTRRDSSHTSEFVKNWNRRESPGEKDDPPPTISLDSAKDDSRRGSNESYPSGRRESIVGRATTPPPPKVVGATKKRRDSLAAPEFPNYRQEQRPSTSSTASDSTPYHVDTACQALPPPRIITSSVTPPATSPTAPRGRRDSTTQCGRMNRRDSKVVSPEKTPRMQRLQRQATAFDESCIPGGGNSRRGSQPALSPDPPDDCERRARRDSLSPDSASRGRRDSKAHLSPDRSHERDGSPRRRTRTLRRQSSSAVRASRSPDSSSCCSSREPSPCARGPPATSDGNSRPAIRRQSTTEEILIARGFRRQSTTEEMIRCRNFRRQSSQSDDVCSRYRGRRDSSAQIIDGTIGTMTVETTSTFFDSSTQTEPSPLYDNNHYHEECLRCNSCGLNLTGPNQKRARRFKNHILCDLHFADVALMECSDFMQQLRSFKPQSLGCAVARRKSSTTLIFPLPPQACSDEFCEEYPHNLMPTPGYWIECSRQKISLPNQNSLWDESDSEHEDIRVGSSSDAYLERECSDLYEDDEDSEATPRKKTTIEEQWDQQGAFELISVEQETYEKYFFGTEHWNYFTSDEDLGPVILSIKQETLNGRDQFRILVRAGSYTVHGLIPASCVFADRYNREEVVRSLGKEVNLNPPLTLGQLPDTPEELLKLDQVFIKSELKVGVIFVKEDQYTEEQILDNNENSSLFEEFLQLLGDRCRLRGFDKYKGGLDTVHDLTGLYSVYTNWRNIEIMFHVSTLLPYEKHDPQKLQRKRHIGNDIVCVVFLEADNTRFSPACIKSHFLHTFILVRVSARIKHKPTRYEVSVVTRDEVGAYKPYLWEQSVFEKGPMFREWLLTKIVNGERASYSAPKFARMQERTRSQMLEDLVMNLSNHAETGQIPKPYRRGSWRPIGHMRPSSPLLDSVRDQFEDYDQLAKDFTRVFLNEEPLCLQNAHLFDVVFLVGQSKQKARFIGVRAILGVRSRVFQEMLYGIQTGFGSPQIPVAEIFARPAPSLVSPQNQKPKSNNYLTVPDIESARPKSVPSSPMVKRAFSRLGTITAGWGRSIRNKNTQLNPEDKKKWISSQDCSNRESKDKDGKDKPGNNQLAVPRLSVCADAQKVDRAKLAQTEFSIIEFDPETFRVLLDYLHTGTCPLTCVSIPGLLCAAEHYDLPELLQACFHHCKQFLRIEVVCPMLISLENYYWRYTSASELVNMILTFVENKAHALFRQSDYLNLSESMVQMIMCRDLQTPEIRKFEAMLAWAQSKVDKMKMLPNKDTQFEFECIMERLTRDLNLCRISPSELLTVVLPSKSLKNERIMETLMIQVNLGTYRMQELDEYRNQLRSQDSKCSEGSVTVYRGG